MRYNPKENTMEELFSKIMTAIDNESKKGEEISIFVNQNLIATFYPVIPERVN